LNWHNKCVWIAGEGKSFIFQLDYNTKQKCIKKEKEIFGYSNHSIRFGGGGDIYISDSSDQNSDSYCNLGNSYELPQGLTYRLEEARKYLAGSHKFKTVEIEVFQVLK
jgi:hypothetical protein